MKFQISDCLLFCTLLSCSLRLAALPSFLFFSIKKLICRAEITVNLRSYQNNINAEIQPNHQNDYHGQTSIGIKGMPVSHIQGKAPGKNAPYNGRKRRTRQLHA